LAKTLELCPEDGLQLCAALASGVTGEFNVPLDTPPPGAFVSVDTKGLPTLLQLSFATTGEGAIDIVLRSDGATTAGAVLTINPISGEAVLDYSDGPLLPKIRPARIQGKIPPHETTEITIVADRAAISGTVNGRPFGFLILGAGPGHDKIDIITHQGASLQSVELRHREK